MSRAHCLSVNSLKEEGMSEWGLFLVLVLCVWVGVGGWMRRVRFIPTGKGGLGLRLNLTL